MQMTRHEAIEVMRYFQNEANMAIDDWGGLESRWIAAISKP